MKRALLVGGLLLGATPSLAAQKIAVDPESAVARATLLPRPRAGAVHTLYQAASDTAQRRLSRGEATAVGFFAGAVVGLLIAHIVNTSKDRGEGKLENYIGIPLGLGLFTAVTVLVATGD